MTEDNVCKANCERPAHSRGFCRTHYKRWNKGKRGWDLMKPINHHLRPPDVSHVSEVDWAYLAGLIDGEGCLFAYHKQANPSGYPTFTAGMRVHMTDGEPLFWAHDLTGAGYVQERERKGMRKDGFQWSVRLHALKSLLPPMMDHLKVKSEEAALMVEFARKRRDRARRLEIVERMRELNRRGKVA